MNAQAIVRVPKSHQGRFAAMLQAIGEEVTPAALLALLVDYADSPEGGRWLSEHYQPPVKGPVVTPEPISWFNSSPIEGA
jgi:hypothetical protein